jgi:hypothetical protein
MAHPGRLHRNGRATPNWQPLPMTDRVVDQGVAALEQAANVPMMFCRLRRSPGTSARACRTIFLVANLTV